jgi:acetyltransferase-like isoleucine patch superfamily enzyme
VTGDGGQTWRLGLTASAPAGSKVRLALAIVAAALPRGARVWVGRHLLGWDVHPTAQIGPTIIAARHVTIGAGARIGSFNLIKGQEELTMGVDSQIGFFNWISGPPLSSGLFPGSPRRHPALRMGDGAAVTARHLIDCTDTVTIGDFATISGWRTSIFTHSVNLVSNRQKATPVRIGERAAVLTSCLLLSGTRVPARTIISAGSVVNTVLTEELALYSGIPAVKIRDLPADLGYFVRTKPFID